MRSQTGYRSARGPNARSSGTRRSGAIIVLTAVMLIIMMALLALSVDTGYMYTIQTELDRSVDAAALAGAASLVEGTDIAHQKVLEYLVRNPVGDPFAATGESELPDSIARFLALHQEDFTVELGDWNAATGQLEPTAEMPSAVTVSMRYPNMPLFFGRVLGKDNFTVSAEATAMYQPRDIVLVLDFSASMNDDSELKSIPILGREAVLENLQQIYGELGSPQYGNLQFDPQYITKVGRPPQTTADPQMTVEYRHRAVYVTSTKDLSSVVLRFSDGRTQTFSGLAGLTGTFAGTSYNANKVVYSATVTSGTNNTRELFDFSPSVFNAVAKTALDLNGVGYPYPSGNWDDYINYVESNAVNRDAEFQYKFGFANLINYWLENKPAVSQTPDLWKVSAQPVTAVKDAVDVFMDYILSVDTNDRLGLVVYNAPDGEGLLEVPLTNDLPGVAQKARLRQAGHYHSYTNIGGGMAAARAELQQRGRSGAFKMIVLMTDGNANWNNGRYDTAAAYNHVLQEASAAASLNYPIVTISLGAGADINLMNQVADITQSRTFNVPGGQPVAAYRDGLFQVFRDIADNRPLKLVQ